ncbi:MAG: hypothetical protein P4L69_09130 [Desulfosporosinus sp.]|nr:hypothetical protein [Desulfosporosinus sp.]
MRKLVRVILEEDREAVTIHTDEQKLREFLEKANTRTTDALIYYTDLNGNLNFFNPTKVIGVTVEDLEEQ